MEKLQSARLNQNTIRQAAIAEAAPSVVSNHKMPQLDALRAFAVFAVLVVHFVGHAPRWLMLIPWAACGVELFFVLSGFLITGILLDSRKQIEAGVGAWWMLRQFYVRRFLRIFPLYYAVIVVGRIIQLNGFTETFGWNLAYLTNFYIVMKGEWIGAASHLWTLSVEEQFYLVWPWIVFFLPKRWLLPSFVGIFLFAIVYRAVAFSWFGPWLNVTPFASFDCFGAGALLALAQRRDCEGHPGLRRTLCLIGLSLGIPLLIIAVAGQFSPQSIPGRLGAMNLAMTFLFTPLISGAASGFAGLPGLILMQKPIRYMGKISYGIYIYHVPVSWLIGNSKWLNAVPRFIPHSAVFFVVTLAVAALSWHLFERPINQLKRLFPYRETRPKSKVDTQLAPLPGQHCS
jgi:peptidoglycan/LPS O-acetylase OafA/YrhL